MTNDGRQCLYNKKNGRENMWAPGNKRDDDDDTKRFNQRLRVRRLVSISLDSLGPIAIGNKRIQSNRKGRSCCWQQKGQTGRLSLLQRATGLLTSRRRKKKMIHKYRKEKTRHVFRGEGVSWKKNELTVSVRNSTLTRFIRRPL